MVRENCVDDHITNETFLNASTARQ